LWRCYRGRPVFRGSETEVFVLIEILANPVSAIPHGQRQSAAD
jgi:hypothetical protein